MEHPGYLSILDFDYHLPEEKIAHYPTPQRDQSKLLVYRNNLITEDLFSNITGHLPEGALMIFNNTRVMEARLLFEKPTGAKIEIFCLEPGEGYPDITTALSSQASVHWKCMIGNAASWTTGMVLEKKIAVPDQIILRAELISREAGYFLVKLSWQPSSLTFAEILHEAGLIPLPPYIKRKTEEGDMERYQTVYAHSSGSVAAPTAGLHFTGDILDLLPEKNIHQDFVTLHVGAGTFKPVKTETIQEHEMHAEFIEVKKSLVEKLMAHHSNTIIAVGTTSLRTLESIYWIGVKVFFHPDITAEVLEVGQWEPYENGGDISAPDALTALLKWMQANEKETLVTRTSLLIAPSYSFKLVQVLVTNFHQPRSTLLLLVAAFAGEQWKRIYDYALMHDFRFLSYGDSCLLFRHSPCF